MLYYLNDTERRKLIIINKLNKSQLNAVKNTNGYVRVIAGSKTRKNKNLNIYYVSHLQIKQQNNITYLY